jgi:hypothetical protein
MKYCFPRALLFLNVLILLLGELGCNRGPQVAPIEGKVTYNGKPLTFGSVMLQPRQGQPAVAEIQSDGSFRLSTMKPNDGAIVGIHKIRVACYESQRNPGQIGGEQMLGKLLIPEKYTFFDQSGLAVEVLPRDNPPLMLDLKDG